MKKLMVMMGVAASAIALNAATVSWTSGTMYLPDEDGAKTDIKAQSGAAGKNAPITGYLWVLDKTAYDKLFVYDALSAVDVDATIANVINTYKGKEATASIDPVNTSNMGAIKLVDPTTYAVKDTAYAAIIYETEVNGQTQYLANLGENYFSADDDVMPTAFGTNFGGQGGVDIQSKWTPANVPEPTSGLLLLLGMAGLALRRRRA